MLELLPVATNHAGVDEAGRGPLVGSVFAAAVVLPPDYDLPGLADSKKLSAAQRDRLAAAIRQQAVAWCVARAEVAEIERLNILHATLLAMRRAVCGLDGSSSAVCGSGGRVPRLPEKVWIDGNRVPPDLPVVAEAVVKGDGRIAQIAAASILAKTARDAEMDALHLRHPQYGFNRHKGYGTAAHLAALQHYGVLPEHRRGFAPVRLLLAQGRLFAGDKDGNGR